MICIQKLPFGRKIGYPRLKKHSVVWIEKSREEDDIIPGEMRAGVWQMVRWLSS
jgi:hypothetical protein